MMTTRKERQEQEAIEDLRAIIKPGDTIYTVLRHVSRSGMYRAIDLFVMENNEPRWISHLAAKLLEGYDNKHDACRASGCGMDMGFSLVESLSYQLYYDYPCLGEKCPSNAHVNYWEHSSRDDEYWKNHNHHDGYALRQRWM